MLKVSPTLDTHEPAAHDEYKGREANPSRAVPCRAVLMSSGEMEPLCRCLRGRVSDSIHSSIPSRLSIGSKNSGENTFCRTVTPPYRFKDKIIVNHYDFNAIKIKCHSILCKLPNNIYRIMELNFINLKNV